MSLQMTTETLMARLTVEAFLAEYMLALDADRLEEWHEFFTEDGSYRVTTRENAELGQIPGEFENSKDAQQSQNPHVHHRVQARDQDREIGRQN